MAQVSDLLDMLEPDPWRAQAQFSEDLRQVHEVLWSGSDSDLRSRESVLGWISRNQSCLFGRAAAKIGLLTLCILNEGDLSRADQVIREKIRAARLEWTRAGFEGRASGFVIVVVSKRIAHATPTSAMLRLAQRLCELYLEDESEILPDKIYLDRIYLEKPGPARRTWWWHAGVNYFCAQGDGRWWHDHRFPGGLALSINSVGHMMKSGRIAAALGALNADLGLMERELTAGPMQDLGRALQVAMQTIGGAASACSGKATRLVPVLERQPALPCPIDLKGGLAAMNYCEYRGYYHTDFTLPSAYFCPDVDRPRELAELDLDFTYLFHRSVGNPAFGTMGEGVPIRSSGGSDQALERRSVRELVAHPSETSIDDVPALRRALGL